MKVIIEVKVEEDSEWADPDHDMGISNDAYDRLTIGGPDWGPSSLAWLGEVQDIRKEP